MQEDLENSELEQSPSSELATPSYNPYAYRKLPLVVEAWQNVRGNELPEPSWLVEARALGIVRDYPDARDGSLQIITLEGKHRCSHGDWIIQGVRRELYPCKPDVFEETYEVA